MINPVAAVSSVSTIVKFIEGDDLERTLADINLLAAKNALSKIPYTKDKGALVWSAVNHLAGAETTLRTTLLARKERFRWINEVGLDLMLTKRTYILALAAICYRYLGKKALSEQTLAMIKTSHKGELACDMPFDSRPTYVSPFAWKHVFIAAIKAREMDFEEGLDYEESEYSFDKSVFRNNLRRSWSGGERDLLSFREQLKPEA